MHIFKEVPLQRAQTGFSRRITTQRPAQRPSSQLSFWVASNRPHSDQTADSDPLNRGVTASDGRYADTSNYEALLDG